MPAPGTLTRWHAPAGPGVRLDGGYDQGETVPGAFDSLVAKLIVTGRDRTQALERSRRALDEFVVDGMPTVIPFHRAVVDDPAFVGDGETVRRLHQLDRDRVRQPDPAVRRRERGARGRGAAGRHRRGRRPPARGRAACRVRRGRRRRRGRAEEAQAREEEGRRRRQRRRVTSPMQGTIVKVAVEDGPGGRRGRRHRGARGDEDGAAAQGPQGRHRHRAVSAAVGDSVTSGAVVCEIKD